MKFTIEIPDDELEALATLIASQNTGTAVPAEEEDDFGGKPADKKELTLADMQEAVGAAVGKHGKEKVKALVEKISKAKKVGDIPADKYQAVLDAIAKMK